MRQVVKITKNKMAQPGARAQYHTYWGAMYFFGRTVEEVNAKLCKFDAIGIYKEEAL